MKCNKYIDKLSFYVLNELSEVEETEISEHIENCYSCSVKVSELKALFDGFTQIEDVELPSDFHKNLVSKAENELWTSCEKKYTYMKFLKYISTAAVFAICIFSAMHLSDFNGLKKDTAMSNSTASAAASMRQQKDSGTQGDNASEGNPSKNGSSEVATNQGKSNENKEIADKSSAGSSKSGSVLSGIPTDSKAPEGSENDAGSVSTTGSADMNSNSGQEKGMEAVKNDTEKVGSTKIEATTKTETSKIDTSDNKSNTLTSASIVRISETTQNIQLKTADSESALKLIREQAVKFDTKVIENNLDVDKKAQADTSSEDRTIIASKITQPVKTIVIEIKEQYVKQFEGFLEENFGKDNLQYENGINEDTSADTKRYVIKITE